MAPEARPATYPSQPILLNVEPTLFVTDFPRSLAFFTDKLAFKVAFTHGEPAFYGQVARDAAILNLRFVHQPVIDHSKERDLLSASIWVSDARALYAEFESRSAPFHQTLKREPWHSRGHGGFIVRDPDDNLLGFGGRID